MKKRRVSIVSGTKYYDFTSANPPNVRDSAPAAVARFWEDFHAASPTEQANFRRRHPSCAVPPPVAPRTSYADTNPFTQWTADDHRYDDKTSDIRADRGSTLSHCSGFALAYAAH
jgi:hypothetical protein